MTRLRTEWITYMLDGMEDYNRNLKEKTGMDLCMLAADLFGASDKTVQEAQENSRVAVIPITQGEGIIGSFSESVAAIVRSMGFSAEVMEHTDVDGIYEALRGGFTLLFFADDVRYLALNVCENKYSDNNYATALGFIRVLFAMMKKAGRDPRKEEILQIGYGIVGKEAAKILSQMGISFVLYDKDPSALKNYRGKILENSERIKDYSFILDFTNEGGWLCREDLQEGVLYVSPGVPYSMNEEAAAFFEASSVHDNLEIGTAVMLGQSLWGK